MNDINHRYRKLLQRMGIGANTRLKSLDRAVLAALMTEVHAAERPYDGPARVDFRPTQDSPECVLDAYPLPHLRRRATIVSMEQTIREFQCKTGIPYERITELIASSLFLLDPPGTDGAPDVPSVGSRLAIIAVDDGDRALLDLTSLLTAKYATCVSTKQWAGHDMTVSDVTINLNAEKAWERTHRCWTVDANSACDGDHELWAAAMTELTLLEDGHDEQLVCRYVMDTLGCDLVATNLILDVLHERKAHDRPCLRINHRRR